MTVALSLSVVSPPLVIAPSENNAAITDENDAAITDENAASITD